MKQVNSGVHVSSLSLSLRHLQNMEGDQRQKVFFNTVSVERSRFLSFPFPFPFSSILAFFGSTYGFGCSSGMGILLRCTARLVGGSYLLLSLSSSRFIRFGPFFASAS